MRRSCPLAVLLHAGARRALVAPPAAAAVIWSRSSPGSVAGRHRRTRSDGSGRLFVVEQGGADPDPHAGVVLATPFLDVRGPRRAFAAASTDCSASRSIRSFATNGHFYVDYTRKSDGATVIARFTVSAANPDVADPASAHDAADDRAAVSNHNGGALRSVPTASCTSAWATAAAATTSMARSATRRTRRRCSGKILRIDVDGGSPVRDPAGQSVRDRRGGPAGDLGARLAQSVAILVRSRDRRPVHRRRRAGRVRGDRLAAGRNRRRRQFRLARMEGTMHGTGRRRRATTPALTPPVLDVHARQGCSVTGGYVYRGTHRACAGRALRVRRLLQRPHLGRAARRRRALADASSAHRAIRSASSAKTRRASFTSPNYAAGDIYQFAAETPTGRRHRVLQRRARSLFHHSLPAESTRSTPARSAAGSAPARRSGYSAPRRSEPGLPVLHSAGAGRLALLLGERGRMRDVPQVSRASSESARGDVRVPARRRPAAHARRARRPVYRIWNHRADSNHRYTTDARCATRWSRGAASPKATVPTRRDVRAAVASDARSQRGRGSLCAELNGHWRRRSHDSSRPHRHGGQRESAVAKRLIPQRNPFEEEIHEARIVAARARRGARIRLAAAAADINVGVTLSATGPAASLGIPQKNTIELLPTTIGGEKINWIVLDDASDTTKAVTNTRKLIERGQGRRDHRLDDHAQFAGDDRRRRRRRDADDFDRSVGADHRPPEPEDPWVFKTPQNDALMADAIAVSMKANGVKTMGYIGFADAYGDGWLAEMKRRRRPPASRSSPRRSTTATTRR